MTDIEMAKECNLIAGNAEHGIHIMQLKMFAAMVRADEREACAKVCEEHPDGLNMMGGHFVICAAAIRARGQELMPLFDDWEGGFK